MSNETTPQPQSVERFSAFSCPSAFEQAQRMAKLLTSSSIVPQSYRDNIADSVIALEMANRIGANPLAVMQNLYIVHGRPAWSSQFLISCINASGKFTPLRYKMTGTRGGDDWGCFAWAVDKSGERLEGPEVTIGTAKAEGWLTKNGSKWKTMPELMLRYRAATLFARLFAPELTMGIQTDDEVIDIAPVVTDPVRAAKQAKATAPEPQFLSAPPASKAIAFESEQLPVAESPATVNLPKLARGLLKIAAIEEAEFIAYLHQTGGVEDSLVTLEEIAEMQPAELKTACDNFKPVEKAIKAARA
jgi:hypothetical protein